ncbi:MAG: hypothetical protein KBA71_07085 [Opitutaceae bacterium]|nr:hypothetical protein [Opitutaceae bacterium]
MRRTLIWASRLALAGVLGFASVAKLRSPREFADAIEAYELVSPWAGAVVAVFLPWFEIAVALALFVPRVRLGATCSALGARNRVRPWGLGFIEVSSARPHRAGSSTRLPCG